MTHRIESSDNVKSAYNLFKQHNLEYPPTSVARSRFKKVLIK